MSATPQDFHLWSQLTGNPYPRTAAEQMYLAPHVRTFVQNIGKQGGYVPQQSRIRRGIDILGKTALAAGGLALAGLAGKHYAEQQGVPVDTVYRTEPLDREGVQDVEWTPGWGGTTNQGGAYEGGAPVQPQGPTRPQGGPSSGLTYEDPWAGSYTTPSADVGRPPGVTLTNLGLVPLSSEPAAIRIANAPVPSPQGPGPESLVGESNIQLGTPSQTPIQRAEGQNDLTLYGHPQPGSVEAFRASREYAQMKQDYPGMHDIVSPTEPASTVQVAARELPQVVRESRDVTPPTPAQQLGQGGVSPDIQAVQIAKGAPPGSDPREFTVAPAAAKARRLARARSLSSGEETQVPEGPDFHPGIERVNSMTRSSGRQIQGDLASGGELTLFNPSSGQSLPLSHPLAQSVLSRYGIDQEDVMAHHLHTMRSAGADPVAAQANLQAAPTELSEQEEREMLHLLHYPGHHTATQRRRITELGNKRAAGLTASTEAPAVPTGATVRSRSTETVPTPRVVIQQEAPAAPTGATVRSRSAGPSEQEKRELMASLNQTHLHISRDQREMLRDQLLREKYSASPAASTEAAVQSETISPKAFLSEKIGREPRAGVQATEQRRSMMTPMVIPARDNEPARIQFHREHGMVPPVKAGSSIAFGHQDEQSRRLSAIQNLGYDPNETESPMWW